MSLPLGSIAGVTWQGAIIPLPIRLCTPIDQSWGPKEVRIDIPWSNAAYAASYANRNVAVTVNLANQQVKTPLEAVRFVKIDNSFNDVAVYLQFSDTLDAVTCPPNSVVGVPVMANTLNFKIYGAGFFTGRAPITSVFLSNAPQDAYFIPGAGQYTVNGAFADIQWSPANANAYNFNVECGAAASPTRRLVLFVFAKPPALGGIAQTVTINGVVTAPLVDPVTGVVGLVQPPGGLAGIQIGAYSVLIPTGTTATLNVALGAVATSCGYCAYVLSDYTSNSVFSVAQDNAPAYVAPNAVLNSIPGSYSMYCGVIPENTVQSSLSWFNAISDCEVHDTTTDFVIAGSAHYQSDTPRLNAAAIYHPGNNLASILGVTWI